MLKNMLEYFCKSLQFGQKLKKTNKPKCEQILPLVLVSSARQWSTVPGGLVKKFRKSSADILQNIRNDIVVLVLAVNINKESQTFWRHTSHETGWLSRNQLIDRDFVCLWFLRDQFLC